MYWRNAEDKPNAKWEADEGIYAVFKTLINIRKEHPDLRGDQYKVLYFNDDALALQRGDGALVVVNRSDTPVRWNEKLGGLNEWQLIFSSTDNTQISLESLIGPVEARIFKKLR
jgi:glycosidase